MDGPEHDYLASLKEGNIEGKLIQEALDRHTLEDVRLSFMQGCLKQYCELAKTEPQKAYQCFKLAREILHGKEIKYDGISIPPPEKK